MKYGFFSKSLLTAVAALAVGGMTAAVNADTIISASQSTLPGTPQVNLTSQGVLDWFIYDGKNLTGYYDTMSGGSGLSGFTTANLSTLTGGNFNAQFTATNGAQQQGITNNQGAYELPTGSSNAFTFTVTGDGGVETLILYAALRNNNTSASISGDTSTDTFTLTNGGAGSPTIIGGTSISVPASGGRGQVWSDTVTFDLAAGDTMNVSLAFAKPPSGGQYQFSAATLAPEPASLAMFGFGAAGLLLMRRRKVSA